MMKKMMGKAPSVGKSVAAGVMLGVVWTIVSAMVIAKMVDMKVLSMENVGYGSMLATLTAVFFGATLAGKKAGHLVIPAALYSGVGYFMCLLLVNALFFGGSYVGMGASLLLVALATGAAILAAGKGRRGKRTRYKIPQK